MVLNIVVPVHNELVSLQQLLPQLDKIKAKNSVKVTIVTSKHTDDGSCELCQEMGFRLIKSDATQRST